MPKRIVESFSEKIFELELKYGHIYDYSLAKYTGYNKPITIRDKETGLCFEQPYHTHLQGKVSRSKSDYAFIEYYRRCLKKYQGRFHYSDYQGFNKSVTIYDIEKDCVFQQNAQYHLEVNCIPKDQKEYLSDFNVFLKKVQVFHTDKFAYLKYDWDARKVTIKCLITGEIYIQSVYEHSQGYFPRGYKHSTVSRGEQLLRDIVDQKYGQEEIIYNSRPKWLNGLELDVYIPSLKLAFEFNGTICHHSNFDHPSLLERNLAKPQDYHLNKWLTCKANGINLIHLYETDIKDMSALIDLYTSVSYTYVQNKCYYLNKRSNPTEKDNPKALILYKPSFEFVQSYSC